MMDVEDRNWELGIGHWEGREKGPTYHACTPIPKTRYSGLKSANLESGSEEFPFTNLYPLKVSGSV